MKKITVPDGGTYDEAGNPVRIGMFYAHIPKEVEGVSTSPTNPDHKHVVSKSGTFECDECGTLIEDAQKANSDNYAGFKVS